MGYSVVLPAVAAASNLVEGPSDAGLLGADVAFGQPNTSDVINAKGLRLVQLTSAGWARYDREDIKAALRARGAALCSASWVYAEPCAEHVVGFMYASARQFVRAWEEQAGSKGWPVREIRDRSRLLVGQKVLLVGYGSIAERVVELLSPLGMKIKALRRSVRGDEKVATYPIIAADELIGEADHVVNILPGTDQTAGFFDARRLGLMKPGAVFYNIGRGTTTVQAALIEGLKSGRIGGAYLDVTDPEPLPPQHELWTAPRCFITPHTAGGHPEEFERQVEELVENLGRLERAEGLRDRVV